MPTATAPNPRATSPDDLDDLFNYDAGIEQALTNPNDDAAPAKGSAAATAQPNADIDEEIKVTRKRAPVAKLDEERILSKGGIPKLRKISKSIKFKGKGHEYSDMSRLLNTYQLWLDDLYPRAKFVDGLSMIEKLGHKKRMHVMRRAWIDEGRPKPAQDSEDDEVMQDDAFLQQTHGQDSTGPAEEPLQNNRDGAEVPAHDQDGSRSRDARREEDPDEDELDALLAEDASGPAVHHSLFGSSTTTVLGQSQPSGGDTFADEEEAMADMEW